jgi:hypothetical protein
MKNFIDFDFKEWLSEYDPSFLLKIEKSIEKYKELKNLEESSEILEIKNKCRLKRLPDKCSVFAIGNSGCEGCGHFIKK